MKSLISESAVALRFFARRRWAVAIIVGTMALSLGANTAVFSLLRAFLFADLAVPEAERVMFVPSTRESPTFGRVDFLEAYPNYKLLKRLTHSFTAISTTIPVGLNWESQDDTRRLRGLRSTASYFDVMRVQPVLGQLFTEKEEGPHAAPVALISHALWLDAFGGVPEAVGRTLLLNGAPHTVIGVLPPNFGRLMAVDIWLPLDLPSDMWKTINGRQLSTYARLAPGVTASMADGELREFAHRAAEADPANQDWGWRVQPMREMLLDGADKSVLLMQTAAAVLLLLATCSLALLLIAWAPEWQREMDGATADTWRIIRGFLGQSLALVALSGAIGVLFASGALLAFQWLNPKPGLAIFLEHLKVDGGTLAFVVGLMAGASLMAGLLSAWCGRSRSLGETPLKERWGVIYWQKIMMVIQIALSVLILVSAGLAVLSLYHLGHVSRGFASANRAMLHVEFPEPAYAAHEKRVQLIQTIEKNLAKEPAVAGYGFTTMPPVVLGDIGSGGSFWLQLDGSGFTSRPTMFNYRRISPGYLAALGVPLVAGRMIAESDGSGSPPVAVVSKALADKYWPNGSAVGRQLKPQIPLSAPSIDIVGVVGNILYDGGGATAQTQASETIYVPFAQPSTSMLNHRGTIILRGHGSMDGVIAAGRHALRAADPGVAAYDIATIDSLVWQADALPRLQATLLGAFAIIALGIVALGSFGVTSQMAANRQRDTEFDRGAGTLRGGVLRFLLLQNARLAAVGVVLGLVASWFVARALRVQLTGFDAGALWPYLIVALLVLGFTQLASYVPARRAAKLVAKLAELKKAHEELERKVAERTAELRSSEESVRLILETASDAIVTAEADGRIIAWNRQAERTFGWSRAEAVGRPLLDTLVPAPQRDQLKSYLAIDPGQMMDQPIETAALHKDGSTLTVELAISSVAHGDRVLVTVFLRDITERKRAEAELAQMHRRLLDISRQAGMAEVATGVLHNVGNVLNSVNVSTTLVTDRVRHSRINSLGKLHALLREHENDLGAFLTEDPKGRKIPAYLGTLAEALSTEQEQTLAELANLRKNVEHIKEIVAMQQDYAVVGGIKEFVLVRELMEDALHMHDSALVRHQVNVVRDYQADAIVNLDRHKVVQILINLVQNAKHACAASGKVNKEMKARITEDDGWVRIAIIDNGVGIPPENLTRIFNHGFTTRSDGHGFGLHSGALAAKELGGALTAQSEGSNCGAVFVLSLPREPGAPSPEDLHATGREIRSDGGVSPISADRV